jgi:hypothetical protein
MSTRKLRHYFSAHPIVVVNEAPLSNILNNPEATGRVSLWGIELFPRDITYEKRKAIKSQILPDFITEWMEIQNTRPPDLSSTWHMNFDGSKRTEGTRARWKSKKKLTAGRACAPRNGSMRQDARTTIFC